MEDPKLIAILRRLRQLDDCRFEEAAYLFVLEALDYTMFMTGKSRMQGEKRHLTCIELVDGIRRYAHEEFGSLAPFTFRSWGVTISADFGGLVEQMCEAGLLRRRPEDRFDAFAGAFDFEESFVTNPGS